MEQQFKRYEFKYIIDKGTAGAIRERLTAYGMVRDPHTKKTLGNLYPVTSLYFDTPTLTDYLDKAGGFLERRKIRIRIYESYLTGATPSIWLEKKSKHEMLISKKRISLTATEYDALVAGSCTDVIKKHPEFLPLASESMRPHIAVLYMREPLIWPHQQNLRVTFDSSIEAGKSRDLRAPCFTERVTHGETIMEVKFSTALPFWFRKILREFNISRTSFSKYGKSVERVYKYHPTPR